MKFIIPLIVIVMGVALVVGFGLLSGEDRTSPTPAQPLNASNEPTFDIIRLEGDVFVKQPGDKDFIKIETKVQVKSGSSVKTGLNGRASIQYPNKILTNMGSSTEVAVNIFSENGQKSKIKLLGGSLWSKIENILGKGDAYEIETPNAVASVRGTIFATEFLKNISLFLVLENKAEVRMIDPNTGQVILEKFAKITLEEGEKTSVDGANLPTKANPLRKQLITKEDLERGIIKSNLGGEYLDRPAIQRLFLKLLKSISLSPTPVKTITLSLSPSPSSSAGPTLTPEIIKTQTPKPVVFTQTSIDSVTPKTINLSYSAQESIEFVVNGKKLIGTKQVLLNQERLGFFVVDDLTIFATLPDGIQPGAYDVSIITRDDKLLTLNQALEIR